MIKFMRVTMHVKNILNAFKRYKADEKVFANTFFPVLIFFFFFHSQGYSQCLYGQGGCTFTQTASVDSCPGVPPNPNIESINQFYQIGGSGVSVLYCGGINTNPNTSGTNTTITLACTPPATATIVAAYLEVVEWAGSNITSTAPVVFPLGASPPGVLVGEGDFNNAWVDPRFGVDGNWYWPQFFTDVRYNVTGLVTPAIGTYAINYAAISAGGVTPYSESLVVVYTVPAPGICGAVALGDGLFVWDQGDLM